MRQTGTALAAILAGAVGLTAASVDAAAETDAQLWTQAGIEHKLSKETRVGFAQHLRFANNISEVESLMPEAFANHRLTKWLRLGGEYRFEYKRSGSGDFVYRHRFGAEARARADLGRFNIDGRTVLQLQVRGIDGADGTRYAWRNRAAAGAKLSKRYDAGVSAEMFHALGDGNGIMLGEVRIMAELEIDLGKQALELGLGVELPIADDTDPTLLITSVGIEFGL